MTPDMLTLIDPISGTMVRITRAQLDQTCAYCGLQMEGLWIIQMGRSPWVHLTHHPRLMASTQVKEAVHG